MEAKVEAKSLKRQSIENLTLCFQCAPYLSRLHIPVVLWNRAPYITPITCKRTFGVIDNPVLEKDRISVLNLNTLAPNSRVVIELTHENGTKERFEAKHSYNEKQLSWFRAGSALNALKA